MELTRQVAECLDDHKAEDIVTIDLRGKTDIADFMVIASGRSQRHVASLADDVARILEEHGEKSYHIEGEDPTEWMLVDSPLVIVHVFHPELRRIYNLEKMWMMDLPPEDTEPMVRSVRPKEENASESVFV